MGRMIKASDINGRNFSLCAIGDSLTAASANNNSIFSKIIRKSGGCIRDAGNFAVASKRSDEVLASQVPQALASNAGSCLVLVGANDISQAISGYLATLKSSVAAIVNRLRAGGIEPIFCLLPPTNTSGNVPATVAYNVWLTLYCRYNNITLIDAWTDLATSAGAFKAGVNLDDVHWNTVGASLVASRALTALQRPFSALPLLAFTDTTTHAGTFVGNAVSFTDTNADGTPDTWFPNGSGGTLSVASADANDLGSWLRCTMAAAASAGANPTAVTLASLGWSIGDTLVFGCKHRWVDSSQALTNSIYYTSITASGQPMFQEKGGETGESLVIFEEKTITAGTIIGLSFFAAGTGYFEVNRPIVVNKTLLGL